MKKCNYCYTENSDDEKYSRKCGEKNGFHHIRLCVFVIIGDIFSFVFKPSNELEDELNIIFRYVRNKGYKIVKLEKIL